MTCILGRCNGQVNAQVGRFSEPTGSVHSRAHEHKSRIDRYPGGVCSKNLCAEGTLECGGLTPPSEAHAGLLACGMALLGSLVGMILETARRRQAAALQSACGAGDARVHLGEVSVLR
jgi:hypothetical protein